MTVKEKWQISAVIFIVIFFLYQEFIAGPMIIKTSKEYYEQFNNADIHGVFSKIEWINRSQGIIVDGVLYVFRPYSDIKGQPIFDRAVLAKAIQ